MGFEAPLLLLGALAAGIPILAHLVRRRDLPVRELPTLVLLSRARAESRRRMQLVDLLLLACRVAMILLLAFAIAGPYLAVRLPWGDGQTASVAIVVDDSMSMAREDGGEPLVRRALARAADVIGSLPTDSEVAVVLGGSPPRVLVPRTDDLTLATERLSEVRQITARGTDVAAAVARATRELSGARNDARRILVLSDGARHAGFDDVEPPDGDVSFGVERIGDDAGPNRAVASAVAVPDPTTPGRASVSIEVRSFGGGEESVDISLARDGEILAEGRCDLRDGVGRLTLHAPLLAEAGDGDPSAAVVLDGSDALSVDDRRAVLLRPPATSRVLLVDGDPHPSRDRDEVGYLTRALDLGGDGEAGGAIGYRVVDADTFAAGELTDVDVVVLANVPAPPAHAVDRLRTFVEGGGGLLVTAGDRVSPRTYEDRLGDLLPTRARAAAPAEPPLALVPHPDATLAPGSDSALGEAQTRRRLVLEEPSGDAHVELSFDDGAPALVVGELEEGRTALLATTADDGWTDLPYRPGFLPLIVRLVSHLSPHASQPSGPVSPGSVVTLQPPPGVTRIEVLDPTGATHVHDDPGPFELGATDAPGAYRVSYATAGRPPTPDPRATFVVAPPVEESDLTPGELPEPDEQQAVLTAGTTVQRPLAPWAFAFLPLLVLIEAWLRKGRATG